MSESSAEVWAQRSYSPVIAVGGPLMLRRQLRKDGGRLKPVKIATTAIVAAIFVTVHVAIDDDGVTVAFGPFGWPRLRYPLSRIRGTRIEAHSALEYIGVVYRWTPTGPRIVLGFGEALVLEFDNGRTFGVTVPHAAEGAAFLNGVLTAKAR